MSKYELIVEHEGEWESVVDFALEIQTEFGCSVVINEINNKGEFVAGPFDWDKAPHKVHKVDSPA